MPRSGRRSRRGSHAHDHNDQGERGRGRGRFFAQGELRLVMLHLLSEQSGSGYDMIRAVGEMTGGRYEPSAGVVYPTLAMLEDLEHVALISSEGPRNTYRVTAHGTAYLTAYEPTLKRLLAKMSDARAERRIVMPEEVNVAFAELETAVRASLRSSDGESAGALAELIRNLARRIGKSEEDDR